MQLNLVYNMHTEQNLYCHILMQCEMGGKILPKERKGFPEFGNSQDHVI